MIGGKWLLCYALQTFADFFECGKLISEASGPVALYGTSSTSFATFIHLKSQDLCFNVKLTL